MNNNKNNLFTLSLFSFFLFYLLFPNVIADTGSVSINIYEVEYNVENGTVESIFLDQVISELIIIMNTSSDGTLEITIPRDILDAKFESTDDIFFILVDNFETDYVEIESDSNTRTLIIPFFSGDSTVEIIGTNSLNSANSTITSNNSTNTTNNSTNTTNNSTNTTNNSTNTSNNTNSTNIEIKIPDWVKNNAGWWADGLLEDNDFVYGIQYLIKREIIIIPKTQIGESVTQEIPDWVKNNAGWWADGLIEDNDFVSGIQYLISNGIINV